MRSARPAARPSSQRPLNKNNHNTSSRSSHLQRTKCEPHGKSTSSAFQKKAVGSSKVALKSKASSTSFGFTYSQSRAYVKLERVRRERSKLEFPETLNDRRNRLRDLIQQKGGLQALTTEEYEQFREAFLETPRYEETAQLEEKQRLEKNLEYFDKYLSVPTIVFQEEPAPPAPPPPTPPLLNFGPDLEARVGDYLNPTDPQLKRILPEGALREQLKQWEFVKKRLPFVLRPSVKELIDHLHEQKDRKFKPETFTLVDGDPGVGKSLVMMHLAMWCRTNGWLTVYIQGYEWMNAGVFLKRNRIQDDIFDQPLIGQKLCQAMTTSQPDVLKQIKLKTDFKVGTFVSKAGESTLYDLLSFGGKPDYDDACDVAYHLRREMNLVTEVPVVIIIDDINLLHGLSLDFTDPDVGIDQVRADRLHGNQLALVKLFKSMRPHGMMNGTMVCALNRGWHTGATPDFWKENAFLNTEQQSYYQKRIPPLSQQEFYMLFDLYKATNIVPPDTTRGTQYYLYNLCGGRGRDLFKFAPGC